MTVLSNGDRDELLIRMDEQLKQVRKTDIPSIIKRLDTGSTRMHEIEDDLTTVCKQLERNTNDIKWIKRIGTSVQGLAMALIALFRGGV